MYHETEQKTFQQLNAIQNALLAAQGNASQQSKISDFFKRKDEYCK